MRHHWQAQQQQTKQRAKVKQKEQRYEAKEEVGVCV